jgi:hypothetical protein
MQSIGGGQTSLIHTTVRAEHLGEKCTLWLETVPIQRFEERRVIEVILAALMGSLHDRVSNSGTLSRTFASLFGLLLHLTFFQLGLRYALVPTVYWSFCFVVVGEQVARPTPGGLATGPVADGPGARAGSPRW